MNGNDSIVPGAGDALAWDRYAYVKYNPIKYVDPSGHSSIRPANKVLMLADTGYNFARKLVGQSPNPSDLENDKIENTSWFDKHNSASWEGSIQLPSSDTLVITLEVDDIVDLYIDCVGIAGDIISIFTYIDPILGDEIPGFTIWITSEGVELVGIGKGVIDATQGDFSNLLNDAFSNQIGETIDRFAGLTNNPELKKLIPGFGLLHNIASISQNYSLDIKLDKKDQ